ncbi:MAG TPA: NmrA family NAD(P)-binding protein [Bryobacteraceae bacterium]|nr:NmrA family NAD(P)-binding protein [Bryobacteraceae bacterium]
MFAVIGITGQVGGAVARELLARGKSVRAIVRNSTRAAAWAAQGCDVAAADVNDAEALTKALREVEGAFVMLPPYFDPSPGFPEAKATTAALRESLNAARPARTVVLSTIGAQAKQTSLLTQLQILEQELGTLPIPITFLRPAWFMENSAWDVAPARETGVITSFLQPLDRPFPMVATADIGRTAAGLLQETWEGHRIVELEGAKRIAPNEIAAAFSRLLGRNVEMRVLPREQWEPLFRSQGMKNPGPRMRMLDGFNEGWIEFAGGEAGSRKGSTPLETVLRSLVDGAGQAN